MALTRYLWFPLWLLVTYISCYGQIESCSPIPMADVKVAVEASSFIYRDKVSVGEYVPGTPYKVIKVVSPSFQGQSLRAIVATAGSTTLICFRGTNNFNQLMQQFKSALKPTKPVRYRGRLMHVLPFFWYALFQFSPRTLVPGGIKSGRKYIVTGHSLGGAMASLFSMDARINTGLWANPHSSMISFGAPRVGDKSYADMHDKLISPDRKLRFVYRQDIVPYIPPRLWYAHHSTKVWISKWYQYFKFRWNMYITVCKGGDNPSGCSSKLKPKINALEHGIGNYRNAIFNGPDRFYDKNNKQRGSFESSQCIS